MINNLKVYGLDNSVRVGKFPKAVNEKELTTTPTSMTKVLAQANKGSGHDCFLKGIVVQFDLTLSIKAWTEAERYHWLDIVSSQSTMHMITKFDLNRNRFDNHVDPRAIDLLKEKIKQYEKHNSKENYLNILYNVPTGFKLTAGITTNYLQLKTIISQRKDHRLTEWKEFCKIMLKGLPHSDWIA